MIDNTNAPQAESNRAARSGLFMRLFNAITFGRVLILAAALAGLGLLWVAIEGWRGKAAFERYADEANARGMSVQFESFIPPAIPDSQNFAQTPSLASLFDFVRGTQKWRDTNATTWITGLDAGFQSLARQKGYELSKNRVARFEIAKRFDPVGLFETNANLNNANGLRQPIPATEADAAGTLIGLIDELCGPMLDELQAASQKAQARFNIQYNSAPVAAILLPHLSVIKNSSQLLALRASSSLVLGETNKAFEDLRLILYLSDTFKGEPFVISHLVRLSCRSIAAAVVWQGMALHRWSDAQLRLLQTGLLADNLPLDGYRVLQGERAGSVRLIDQIRTRAGGADMDQIGYSDNDRPTFNMAHAVFPSGWFYLEALNLCLCYDQFLPSIDEWIQGKRDYPAVIAKTTACADELSGSGEENPALMMKEMLWKHRFLSRMLVPGVTRMFGKTVQAQARNEQIIGACALERFFLAQGQYPETLEKLVPAYLDKVPKDPFSGGPMQYRRDADKAYRLYSVGPNCRDDGGNADVDKKGVSHPEQGDLVWKIQSD
jgi:hypothetical protein